VQQRKIRRFSIQERPVGEGEKCFFIAEVGLGHDGSLGTAHAFVDAVAGTGADAVKFQTHIADAEGTDREAFRVNVFRQDRTRRDYWKRTAFTEEQWRELKGHADDVGLIFLSSPFSVEAVRLLDRIGVPAWKIASGETSNLPLLTEVLKTGRPVLMSTGMSTAAEVDAAVGKIRESGVPAILYQCTNRYPCPPEHLGLNVLGEYRERYGLPVGLSDHSGVPAVAAAAVALGACSIEVHVTFSKKAFGPDVPASLTIEELADVIEGGRYLERALSSPVDKEREAEELAETRALFTKSVVAARDLAAGQLLAEGDLSFKKPGTGIPAARFAELLGRTVRRALAKDDAIGWEDLEGPGA
jgi:N-acetylneuraminate synthase